MVREEVVREEVVREEGVREEVVREEGVREEGVREEVVREEVVREEVVSQCKLFTDRNSRDYLAWTTGRANTDYFTVVSNKNVANAVSILLWYQIKNVTNIIYFTPDNHKLKLYIYFIA